MGLLGILTETVKAAANTVLIPVDLTKEVVNEEPGKTEDRIEKVRENLEDAGDEFMDMFRLD